jgi:hypothetical protein
MATQTGQYSFTIIDELGVKASMPVPISIDDSKTVAQLIAASISYGDVVDAATGGVLDELRIVIFTDPTTHGWKTEAVEGSRVEQTGLFNFKPSGVSHRYGIDLPAILDTLVSTGKILLGTGAAQDFIDLILAGVSADGVASTNPARQALTAFTDALITFRKHRRALDRRSFETP